MAGIVETIGSYCGLIAFVFTASDRFLKNRPVADISIIPRGDTRVPQITLKNVDDRSIIVRGIEVRPKAYFVEPRGEVRNLIEAQLKGFPCTLVKPGELQQFTIYSNFKDGVPLETQYNRVRAVIHWRRGNAMWLPQLPVRVFLTTKGLRDILKGTRGGV